MNRLVSILANRPIVSSRARSFCANNADRPGNELLATEGGAVGSAGRSGRRGTARARSPGRNPGFLKFYSRTLNAPLERETSSDSQSWRSRQKCSGRREPGRKQTPKLRGWRLAAGLSHPGAPSGDGV